MEVDRLTSEISALEDRLRELKESKRFHERYIQQQVISTREEEDREVERRWKERGENHGDGSHKDKESNDGLKKEEDRESGKERDRSQGSEKQGSKKRSEEREQFGSRSQVGDNDDLTESKKQESKVSLRDFLQLQRDNQRLQETLEEKEETISKLNDTISEIRTAREEGILRYEELANHSKLLESEIEISKNQFQNPESVRAESRFSRGFGPMSDNPYDNYSAHQTSTFKDPAVHLSNTSVNKASTAQQPNNSRSKEMNFLTAIPDNPKSKSRSNLNSGVVSQRNLSGLQNSSGRINGSQTVPNQSGLSQPDTSRNNELVTRPDLSGYQLWLANTKEMEFLQKNKNINDKLKQKSSRSRNYN